MATVLAAARPDQGRIQEALTAFNDKLGTGYALVEKADTGASSAFFVSDGRGPLRVFKWVSTEDFTSQLKCAGEIAQRVRMPQTRVPRHERYAYMPGIGTAYTQEYVPGIPAPYPTTRVVEQMLRLSERFKGQAVPGSDDPSQVVRETVLEDAQGWQATVKGFSRQGSGLVQEFQRLVAPYESFRGRTTDIVHGNFTHHNALIEAVRIGGDSAPHDSHQLEGYVNWETAGRGDRAYDQARLLFDVYVSWPELRHPPEPAAVKMLTDRIVETSGVAALNVYTAYWSLQLAAFGVREKPQMAPLLIESGRNVLKNLKQVTAASRHIASLG